MTISTMTLAAAAVLAGSALFSPAMADRPGAGSPRPTATDLRIHEICNAVAETRFLSFVEARICNFAYLRIKLAFVPGVDHADFTNLSAAEQARVNMEGYRAYRQWADAHPRELNDPERPESTDVDLLSN